MSAILESSPQIKLNQQIGEIRGGQVIGIQVGTLVTVHVAERGQVETRVELRHGAPYKYLESYDASASALFFGRRAPAREITGAVLSRPVVILSGAAAVGKTSLVQAGVIPLLTRDNSAAVITLRDYADAPSDLRAALTHLPASALQESDSLDAQLVHAAQQTRRLVLVLDQAERLLVQPTTRQIEFLRALGRALDAARRLCVVLVIRREFLHALGEIAGEMQDTRWVTQPFWLRGLARDEARAAIVEPLRAADGFDRARIEPALAERLLEQLPQKPNGDDVEIEPAALQIVCSRLYAEAVRRAGQGAQPQLTLALYAELGGASGILHHYLTGQKDALGANEAEWNQARRILNALALNDALAFVPRAEIAHAAGLDDATAQRWLQRLERQRLVVARGDSAYALAGNFLASEIRAWFPEELDRETANQAVARALADWDDQQLLMDPRRLERIRRARSLVALEPKGFALLLRSAVAYQANVAFWLNELRGDARILDALRQWTDGAVSEPATQMRAVLTGETGSSLALGDAAVRATSRDARIASALALSVLGTGRALAALEPAFRARDRKIRAAAVEALAWMRFADSPTPLPPVGEPFVSLRVMGLRLWSKRVQIATMVCCLLVASTLIGVLQPLLTFLLAGFFQSIPPNPLLNWIIALGVSSTLGIIVGFAFALPGTLLPRQKGVETSLRVALVIAAFGFANALLISASMNTFVASAFFIGAIAGSGFALAHEYATGQFLEGDERRVWIPACGLLASAALATLITIAAVGNLTDLDKDASLPWRFGGGFNPQLLGYMDLLNTGLYVVLNATYGFLIGLCLAIGFELSKRLARILEQARYV